MMLASVSALVKVTGASRYTVMYVLDSFGHKMYGGTNRVELAGSAELESVIAAIQSHTHEPVKGSVTKVDGVPTGRCLCGETVTPTYVGGVCFGWGTNYKR